MTDVRPARGEIERWTAPLVHPAAHLVTGVAGLAVVLAWGLFGARSDAVTGAERQLLVRLNGAWTPGLDAAARWTNAVFSTPGAAVLIVLVVAAVALATRRMGDALFTGFAIGVVYSVVWVLKIIVGRPRPPALPHPVAGVVLDTSPSYPSGHTAIASALVVVVFIVVRRTDARWVVGVVGGLAMVWTAYSRLYVGAHYPDDVAASIVYAITAGPLIYQALFRIDARLGAVAAVNRRALTA